MEEHRLWDEDGENASDSLNNVNAVPISKNIDLIRVDIRRYQVRYKYQIVLQAASTKSQGLEA
jgi:hypothetical protein